VKLHLDSEEDAEYIVGKAVRDGVIEARVDHSNGWMISQARAASSGGSIEGLEGVYATAEPQEVFTKRIRFCLDLHNESVKVSTKSEIHPLSFLLPFQSSRGIGNCRMQIVPTFIPGPPACCVWSSNPILLACFATSTHSASLQAMRYPLNAHRKELQSAEAAREREKELAKEIVDADLDDEGDGGPGLGGV